MAILLVLLLLLTLLRIGAAAVVEVGREGGRERKVWRWLPLFAPRRQGGREGGREGGRVGGLDSIDFLLLLLILSSFPLRLISLRRLRLPQRRKRAGPRKGCRAWVYACLLFLLLFLLLAFFCFHLAGFPPAACWKEGGGGGGRKGGRRGRRDVAAWRWVRGRRAGREGGREGGRKEGTEGGMIKYKRY